MSDPIIRTVLCPWCGQRLDVGFVAADDGRVFGSTPVHACTNTPTGTAAVPGGLTPLPPPPSVRTEAAA